MAAEMFEDQLVQWDLESFNEAAANGRGNARGGGASPADVRRASMRPRRMAAEIPTTHVHAPSLPALQ